MTHLDLVAVDFRTASAKEPDALMQEISDSPVKLRLQVFQGRRTGRTLALTAADVATVARRGGCLELVGLTRVQR